MRKRMTLRNTILITMILVTTILVAVLGSVSSRRFGNALTERTVSDYQETVNAVQKNMEALIIYAQDFAKYLSLDESVLETITEYQRLEGRITSAELTKMRQEWNLVSGRLINSTSMLYNLEIYSQDHLIYSYYNDPIASEEKNIPDELLREAVGQAAPVWSDLLALKQFRSYAKKTEYGIAVVKSVRNEWGRQVGAIALYVREPSFAEILQTVDGNTESSYYLINGEDKILSAMDKGLLHRRASASLGLSYAEYQKCLENGIYLKEQSGKAPFLYVSRGIGDKGLKIVCKTAMVELAQQQKELRFFMGVMAGVAVLAAVFCAWLVSSRITKPLGRLMEIMRQIKEDDSSQLRFQGQESGEIGVLGNRFNELMDRLDASREQMYQEQRQRRHNEVALLQAQIVPHFLYNTMGIIASFVKLGMKEEALTTIQNLVSFYRLSLSSGKEIITIGEEVELTGNYMALQQLRYIEYIEYTMECKEGVKDLRIPKLTIQPLVENILHHGLKPNGDKCRIHVSIDAEGTGNFIVISVEDNGRGISRERLSQLRESLKTGRNVTKSFGILNVHQRLKLMYGDEYHMDINSVEGAYTLFTLYLPKQKEEAHV